MAMTTKRQILNLLNGAPVGYTDNTIASYIDRPVPSVRRTRIEMERDGLLTMANSSIPLEWKLTNTGRSLAGAR
jgi:hypothetical protein